MEGTDEEICIAFEEICIAFEGLERRGYQLS